VSALLEGKNKNPIRVPSFFRGMAVADQSTKRPLPQEFINTDEEPAQKKVHVNPSGIPEHQDPVIALVCNANALKLYELLNQGQWVYHQIKSIAFNKLPDRPTYPAMAVDQPKKKLIFDYATVSLKKPDLLALIRSCPGLVLPAEFIPPTPTTYVDMEPLIRRLMAAQPRDYALLDAIDVYCQKVEVELQGLEQEFTPFYALEMALFDFLQQRRVTTFGPGTVYWPCKRDTDIGHPRFHFKPTIQDQEQVVPLLQSVRRQPCFQ